MSRIEKVVSLFKDKFNCAQSIMSTYYNEELLGCDINTLESKDYYNQNEFFEKKCLQI